MQRHPPDCPACAANRAALLKNAIPTHVCAAQQLTDRKLHHKQPLRPPLRQLSCSQLNANLNKPSQPQPLPSVRRARVLPPHQAGLKTFTTLVADKLRHFRCIQHTVLADTLVNEALQTYSNSNPCYDLMTIDKNIRRRTYDALNVFASMGIVLRRGKIVEWKGHSALFHHVRQCACEKASPTPTAHAHAQSCCHARMLSITRSIQTLRRNIERKRSYLQTLHRHKQSMCALLSRNLQSDSTRVCAGKYSVSSDLAFRVKSHASTIQLPFVLVVCNTQHRSKPSNIHLSEDRLTVGLTLDSPFRVLHDYTVVDRIMTRK
ncbi:Transcription factor Dp-1 [Gracilariopsis chorda]|uniref:Transcription factor Dp-1 n=1 Tax=Gracilariopsis chorda TaxID=448386 RepID=A0A2V3IID4_9FLOR|nr:Transcription factor Dp-1 [Gracilariopsis chorda]|eukprot:PXF41831.1 Transcription factor Dp-1 [Gracilariopsis chorda]